MVPNSRASRIIHGRHSTIEAAGENVMKCANPAVDNFFSYNSCCDNSCCYRLRFWVIPVAIASFGFVAGAFFALCFQCR
uniref:CX domain-containing protein n=1 Tax=Heterorhabditis bacteriophora TaxID=37862 RepID=A0A1I7XIZ2_HETBA